MASASTQQQPVVQVIFDSLTRCFNPIDGESTFSGRCPRQSAATAFDGESEKNKSRHSSSGASSSDSRRQSSDSNKQSQYDADRYIHRKLEIFRTTEEDIAEMGIILPPKKQSRSSGGRGHRRGRSANTLVASSDGDEIATLTGNHKRKVEEYGNGKKNNYQSDNNPVATLVRLLKDPFSCISEVQKPLGLCFATPVRTSSAENVSKMSDWKLTAEEFAARHQENGKFKCSKLTAADVPDADESSGSLEEDDEENTMTSASYFDQKYSHLVETNPPMPLFGEQRIAVSEHQTDEIFRLVKKREGKGSPPRKPGSRDNSPHPNSNRRPSPAPTGHIIVKKTSSVANVGNTTPRIKGNKSSNHRRSNSGRYNYDSAPMGKSSSVSTQSGEESNDNSHRSSSDGSDGNKNQSSSSRRLREPDIVYSTAAGI